MSCARGSRRSAASPAANRNEHSIGEEAMKFSVSLPIDHLAPAGEFQTLEAVREIAAALDKSRAYACYLTDHPAPSAHWLHNTAGGHDALDPFAGLAFIAALTDRIRLLTNIVVLPYRSPFITAKS